MTAIDVDALIEALQENPTIWDKTRPDYKDRGKTYTAWRRVYNTLDADFDHLPEEERTEFMNRVNKKWKTITSYFRKYLADVNNSPEGTTVKQFAYYDKMRYLLKVCGYGDSKPAATRGCKSTVSLDRSQYEFKRAHSVLDSDNSSVADDTRWQVPDQSSSSLQYQQTDGDQPVSACPEPSTSQSSDEQPWKKRRIDESSQGGNPHLLFFKGILPNLTDFTNDETMNFQMGVLQLIKNTKEARLIN